MFINKICISNKAEINKNKNTTFLNPKVPNFSGKDDEYLSKDNNKNEPLAITLVKKILNSVEIERIALQKKINNNKVLNQNENIKEIAQKMAIYAKNKEQKKLINKVLTNEKLLNEKSLSKIKYAIFAATNPAKQQLLSQIFSNEVLYTNENLIENLEKILYTDNFENVVMAKISVIDKIINNEIFAKNKVFMSNITDIILQIDSKVASETTNSILDCILNNKKCSQNQDFIGALGKVFATQEFHRRYGDALNETKEGLGNDDFYKNIIGAISFVLNHSTLRTFTKIMNDTIFLEDKNFISYFPQLVSLTLYKNEHKIENVVEYIKKNANRQPKIKNDETIKEYLYYDFDSMQEAERYIKVRETALNKKYQLKESADGLCNQDIISFFEENREAVKSAIKLLGEDVFVHAFPQKLSGLQNLAENCLIIQKLLNKDNYEDLLLKMNPSESQKYQELKKEISELKKQYPTIKNSGDNGKLKLLQNEINTKTKQTQELIKNKIKLDPDTKINKIKTFAGVVKQSTKNVYCTKKSYSDDKNLDACIKYFLSLLKDFTPENEENWNKAVAEKIFEKVQINYDKTIATKVDFTKSKYIDKVLSADSVNFFMNLKDIFVLIKEYPDKSITEVFNNLPCNKRTKELFDKFGINYEKWVNFDENSKVKTSLDTLKGTAKDTASELLNSIFNDDLFNELPKNLKNDLKNALGLEGITFGELQYFDGNTIKRFNSLNDIKVLKKAIQVIQNELNKDQWTSEHPDENINYKKRLVYNSLLGKIAKIREILATKPDMQNEITIQKVDMNNLVKSLFLGNDASCCTSIGRGSKQWTAPVYAKNKMFGAIEILENKTSIGNTMCYFALVNGELAFVLDDIELKPKYKNDNNIRDGIIKYAKQLCKEVGVENIPIYMVGHRHNIDTSDFFKYLTNVQLIGSTGEDRAYLDFLNYGELIDFDSCIHTGVITTRVA